MRIWATLTYIGLLASAALAQGDANSIYSATKNDVVSGVTKSSDGGASLMPLIQMALAVTVVVFLLKGLLPKIAVKLNKSLSTKTGGAIKIEESATFAGGTLYIVNAKAKTLLISVNGTGVNCLADITDENPKPVAPTFMEILEERTTEPQKAEPKAVAYLSDEFVPAEETQSEPSEDFAIALERLNRIAK
ncbi:MAG: hypothetical protein KF784_14970 [Fimbriimonadaceae bacterium]|nr:hypothetical protein [Fimbriimonadaceae bacterium]